MKGRTSILIILIFLSANLSFAQDSIQIVDFLSNKSFDDIDHELGNLPVDSIIVIKIIFSGKTLEINSYQYDEINIEAIIKNTKLEFLQTIGENEIHITKHDNRTNYYRCFSIDSVLFYRYAQITIPLYLKIEDSIFLIVKNEMNNGKQWNQLKFHPTICNSEKQPSDQKGSSGWIRSGELIEDFEKQVINLKKGELIMIKLEQYNIACIIFQTDIPVFLAERKIKLVSVPKSKL